MRNWMALVASIVLAAAVGVGCTGGDSTAGAGAPIKLGFSAWPGWFPWQVAKDAGIFKEAGVNVELVWFEGYLDSINALAGGKLDANSQTLNDTIGSVAAGADQVIVLVNDNSTGNDQIIATREIRTVADLKGKKVGIEAGVVDHFLLLLGLKAAGMSEKDVTIVNLETGAAAAAFASGQLDAVGVFAPFTTQALKREGSHSLVQLEGLPGRDPGSPGRLAQTAHGSPGGCAETGQRLVHDHRLHEEEPGEGRRDHEQARRCLRRRVQELRGRHDAVRGAGEHEGIHLRFHAREPRCRHEGGLHLPARRRLHQERGRRLEAFGAEVRR